MHADAHATLDVETIKLNGFSLGDELSAFIGGLFDLKTLPFFFKQQTAISSEELVYQESALV